jgi:cytochrome b involved in lipid metabolism
MDPMSNNHPYKKSILNIDEMKSTSDRSQKNKESKSYRDYDLERIVGDMSISQYQSHVLKSRLDNKLAGWWILSQDREYDSSSFTFSHYGKKFKISSSLVESTLIDD